MKLAALRVCASCEWIFTLPAPDGCPKCQFDHYGAHYVYGKRAYRYAVTQKPWYDKKLADYSVKLQREIADARGEPAPRWIVSFAGPLGIISRGRGRGG